MGFGDQLMATGLAKGAKARGKRIAFGDGNKILWDHYSDVIFRGNPNVARPGSEQDDDLEWIHFYRGHRLYNRHDVAANKWVWSPKWRPKPGELFFAPDEMHATYSLPKPYILVEPHASNWKVQSTNKQWPLARYVEVIRLLKKDGHHVVQLKQGLQLPRTYPVESPSFRHAAAIISKASLFIGSEGGLHHAAAAGGIPAVVIFGGWIPPQVTGYDFHVNLAHGKPCGSLFPCPHCQKAMEAISVEQVYEAAQRLLNGRQERTRTA